MCVFVCMCVQLLCPPSLGGSSVVSVAVVVVQIRLFLLNSL